APAVAPGCPSLGEDSVLERPDSDVPGRDNVQPGLHELGGAGGGRYPVVWWDPRALTLDVKRVFGIRHPELIEDPGAAVLGADRARYEAWQRARETAREQGARPTFAVKTVTEWSAQPGDAGAREVDVIDAASGIARPSGPRFGTLVHAVLATAPLDSG